MKRNKKKTLWIIVGVIAALILSMIIYLFVGSTPATVTVYIPENATSQQVKDSLVKVYGKDYAAKLEKTAAAMGQDLTSKPGRYVIDEGTSRFMVVWRLTHGKQTPVKITINGLRTRQDILNAVCKDLEFSAAELDRALNDSAFMMEEFGLTPANANALFLNYSHEVFWNATPEGLLSSKIGRAYNKFWNDDRKKKAKELGLSPAEVTTIASIIEEESLKKDEYGKIARVYINRLHKGMRLQSCPTVKFAMNDFSIQRVNRDMLQFESPYHTYRITGLPPGPIRTVEPSTIDAVLDSEPSDDLYMCAKADFSGYHHFSSDYTEHMRYSNEYSNELDKRGIK